MNTEVIIDKHDLRRIKSKAVYPLMDEIFLNDEEIKLYAVRPALEEYFRWFPKEQVYHQSVSGEFSVDFPDIYTFGIVDARIIPFTGTNVSLTGNRLADMIIYQQYGKTQSYRGGYGTRYNFEGQNRARMMEQTLRNMQVSRLDNNRLVLRLEESKVKGYVGGSGTLSIIWAKFSYSFSDIRFERKEDVIKLSQAYLLHHIVDSFLIDNPNLDVELDKADITEKAEKLEGPVIEDWKNYPKVIVIPKNTGIVTI